MPEVKTPLELEDIFKQAKAFAAAGGPPEGSSVRHLLIVTPERNLLYRACPTPGTMDASIVANMEQLIPADPQRKVAVIAYTDTLAMQTDIARTIPFIGLLLGLSYIGHAVWIFEGHASALEAGCRDADVVLVDGEMMPHLATDWYSSVSSVMAHPQIYAHDRSSFSLRKVGPRGVMQR